MTQLRRVLLIAAFLCLIVVIILWWNRPNRVDMASYAPADSLVYLEANSLIDLANGIGRTNAWNAVAPILGIRRSVWTNSWITGIARWTGIGPIETVIASRAQVAVVMSNLGTAEEGDVLRVKPELAVLIETHTSRFRIRSAVEKRLQALAEATFGQTSFTSTIANGQEFLVWNTPSSSRQLIAVIDGSLIIVGNSQAIVAKCLSVRHGEQSSLARDPELQIFRQRMRDGNALAFGYVSSPNAARLASIAAPLLLGRSNNSGLQTLLVNAADKILGAIAWGAFSTNGLIEDRYLITLQHPVIDRLQPSFAATLNDDELHQFLPPRPYSITDYRYREPLAAWKGLESAGLARLDAVSAAVFKTLLDSALVPYGINEPEKFLTTVGPPLMTVRLQGLEKTVVVARIVNKEELQQLLLQRLGPKAKHQSFSSVEIIQASDDEWAAAFAGEDLLMGDPEAVRSCLQRSMDQSSNLLRNPFTTSAAAIVTYTDDSDRVRNFFNAFAQANKYHPPSSTMQKVDQTIAQLPYAVTETTLGDDGIVRRTRSPLGQFSSFFGYLFPDKTNQ